MNVSPNELRRETVAVLHQVNKQIGEVELRAQQRGVEPSELVDERGAFHMPPLLLAKSTCLLTLTQLNEQGRTTKRS